MTIALTPLLLLFPVLPWHEPDVRVLARLEAERLVVGESYAARVSVELPASLSSESSAARALFVQLDAPASIELLGERPTGYDALAANEFLQEPFERLLEGDAATIPFRYLGGDDAGSLGIVVLGYLRDAATGEERFLRKRVELPVKARAEGVPGDASDSSWGDDPELLQIGDVAPSFDAALVDGTGRFTLDEVLGRETVIVTTYRAFW